MWPDRVSNPGPLTYESGALPIALRGPAHYMLLILVIRLFISFLLVLDCCILTKCTLVDSSIVICRTSLFVILGV